MIKAAVILSGCGYLDGAEIRESVLALLELDRLNVKTSIFAPNINQHHVMNHLTKEQSNETRNVLVESARIARGEIEDITKLEPIQFDCLILPGGFGVAKNLSNLAEKGADMEVIESVKNVILKFFSSKKPIGAICISPGIIAATLKDKAKINLTLGDHNPMLKQLHHKETICNASSCVADEEHKIVTTPAYMLEDSLSHIHNGIKQLIKKVIELC